MQRNPIDARSAGAALLIGVLAACTSQSSDGEATSNQESSETQESSAATEGDSDLSDSSDSDLDSGAPTATESETGSESESTGSAVPTCPERSLGAVTPYRPVYRVPLQVHTTRSDLTDDALCDILQEINEMWWTQASICFEMNITASDENAPDVVDMWFEREAPFPNGTNANGVYIGGQNIIYTLDEPSLGAAPNPAQFPAARTAAHELGHALSLGHQNCGSECNDLLMTSGRQGFAIVTGAPANEDEVGAARERAQNVLALDDTSPESCGPAVFVD